MQQEQMFDAQERHDDSGPITRIEEEDSVAQKPTIYVCAKIPIDTDNDLWEWTCILAFPIEILRQLRLSYKLYKWLRYATGVVLGMEGDLRTGKDTMSDAVDYETGDDAFPKDTSFDLYYHYSMAGMRLNNMLPIDPSFHNEGLTSSEYSTRKEDFRDAVSERDGGNCVITNDDDMWCDAAHLIAHNKGDAVYILYRFLEAAGSLFDSISKRLQEDDAATKTKSYSKSMMLETVYS